MICGSIDGSVVLSLESGFPVPVRLVAARTTYYIAPSDQR